MHDEPTTTSYLIEFKTTDLVEEQPTNDTVIINAPNETQAEILFAQDFDSALYTVTNISEWEIP